MCSAVVPSAGGPHPAACAAAPCGRAPSRALTQLFWVRGRVNQPQLQRCTTTTRSIVYSSYAHQLRQPEASARIRAPSSSACLRYILLHKLHMLPHLRDRRRLRFHHPLHALDICIKSPF